MTKMFAVCSVIYMYRNEEILSHILEKGKEKDYDEKAKFNKIHLGMITCILKPG